jgi:DNA-binding NtrC family response regulator
MKGSLLIVDDEEEIREMLARNFRFKGYEVVLASNGKEALDALSSRRFDVMISDIMMPEMNGVELLRKCRDDYPLVRSIMMTGYVLLENALSCMRYGADYCVFKPFANLSELDKAVEDSIAKNKYWMNVLKELRELKPNKA